MTKEEVVAKLAGIQKHPWSGEDWNSFLAARPDDQALMVQMLQDSAEPAPTNAWTEALAILADVGTAVGSVVAAITGVDSAVNAIKDIIKTV